MTDETLAEISDALVERIKPILAGQSPQVQGAVVADLTAIWLGGHHALLRTEALDVHVRAVCDLMELYAEQFGTGPTP